MHPNALTRGPPQGAQGRAFIGIADALRAQEPGMRDAYAESLEDLNVAWVRVCALSGKMPGG